jgi:hypothetical protein
MSVNEWMKEAISKFFTRDTESVFAVSSTISQAWSLVSQYDNGEITIDIDDDSKEITVTINFPVKVSHTFPPSTIVILKLKNGTFFFCDGGMCGIATNENLFISQL